MGLAKGLRMRDQAQNPKQRGFDGTSMRGLPWWRKHRHGSDRVLESIGG